MRVLLVDAVSLNGGDAAIMLAIRDHSRASGSSASSRTSTRSAGSTLAAVFDAFWAERDAWAEPLAKGVAGERALADRAIEAVRAASGPLASGPRPATLPALGR